jgi:hypothetical protein
MRATARGSVERRRRRAALGPQGLRDASPKLGANASELEIRATTFTSEAVRWGQSVHRRSKLTRGAQEQELQQRIPREIGHPTRFAFRTARVRFDGEARYNPDPSLRAFRTRMNVIIGASSSRASVRALMNILRRVYLFSSGDRHFRHQYNVVTSSLKRMKSLSHAPQHNVLVNGRGCVSFVSHESCSPPDTEVSQ